MKKLFIKLIIFTFIFNKLNSSTLNELGLKHGTDKSSYGHNYTPIYERYFSPLRHKKIKFLEIGFAYGSSARMFQDYFSNADLHIIEFHEPFIKNQKGLNERTKVHLANQESIQDLNRLISKIGGDFDIIIDDGGHKMNEQINSFKALFPHVKPGGMYIVEDLHSSYMPVCSGEEYLKPGAAIKFFLALVHDLNIIGAKQTWADRNKISESLRKELTYYQENIEAIHFYTSLCFIFKKK